MRRKTYFPKWLMMMLMLSSLYCRSVVVESVKDTIVVDFVPVIGSTLPITGYVYNVSRSNNRIAGIIKVPGLGWWTKPYWASPSVPIDTVTGRFILNYNTGGYDMNATVLGLFLVPKDFEIPLLGGVSAIPPAVFENSISYRLITRDTTSLVNVKIISNKKDTICFVDNETVNVILTAVGGSSYYWYTTNRDITQTVTVYPYYGSQTIRCEVSDGLGNGKIATANIFVFPRAYLIVQPDSVVNKGTIVTLKAAGNAGSAFKWSTGDTTQVLHVNPTETTTYSVEVRDPVCGKTTLCVTVRVLIPVRADEVKGKNIDFKIFPNPAHESLNVTTDAETPVSLSIKSLQGSEVIRCNFIRHIRISTSNLNPGYYITEMRVNKRFFREKLLIAR